MFIMKFHPFNPKEDTILMTCDPTALTNSLAEPAEILRLSGFPAMPTRAMGTDQRDARPVEDAGRG